MKKGNNGSHPQLRYLFNYPVHLVTLSDRLCQCNVQGGFSLRPVAVDNHHLGSPLGIGLDDSLVFSTLIIEEKDTLSRTQAEDLPHML